jgi:ribosomal protein S18 acetylase RimI-like enzyme
MWCGHRDGPALAEKVISWASEPGVHSFGLFDGDSLVGYGEAWVDDDEEEVELARLIVDPDRRGQGLGRILVGRLVAEALNDYPDVFMRVHPDNVAALRCYTGAHFIRVPAEQAAEWNAAQPVPYVWLTYHSTAG